VDFKSPKFIIHLKQFITMKTRTIKKLKKLPLLVAFTSLSCFSVAQTFNWSPAGPVYNAGRARNLIVDKGDLSGNTLYTVTHQRYFHIKDGVPPGLPLIIRPTVRNINYMAQGINNAIYVATGEGFLRASQKNKAQPGTGLYKLNGSELDQRANSIVTGSVINPIVCHPSDSNKIAIASNLGVLLSANKGFSFTILAGLPVGSSVAGLDVKLTIAAIILHCWQ